MTEPRHPPPGQGKPQPSPPTEQPIERQRQPNIVFLMADNLGWGELGCYGCGGVLRGAPTPNLDRLAAEGTRLLNMNVEAQCTPSRSAIMTGRYSIRSGTHSVPIGGGFDGLTSWEITIAKALKGAGYATAHFGKWHLGSVQARLPSAMGFDVWYGIPRTTDEAMWPEDPRAAAAGVPAEWLMEGVAGADSREVKIYDLAERRLIDAELTQRAIAFMRQHGGERPFYAYVPFTQPHMPTLPHPDFAGKTGYGDYPDVLGEIDHHVGEILAAIDDLGIRNDTIVVFTSDNGPEATWPWHGHSGPWAGYYFTHMEGSCRVPFIIRWPGKIPAGRISNEIMHGCDTFTTFAMLGGAQVPTDRAIDGLDQSAFLLGGEKSARNSVIIFVADRLEAVKWNNFKLSFFEPQRDWWSPPVKYGTPQLFDLILDPKEEHPQLSARNSWAATPIAAALLSFLQTFANDPPIAPGTPDPYTPAGGATALSAKIVGEGEALLAAMMRD
jgi:arylsulfatase A-like enzyme